MKNRSKQIVTGGTPGAGAYQPIDGRNAVERVIERVRGNATNGSVSIPHAVNGVETGIVDVTPDQARAWLDSANQHNRAVNPRWVAKYARDMEAGNWRLDGMPLRFAGEFEQLLDGQHRLMAQARTDQTVTYVVVKGLNVESQTTMDQGRGRSLSDVLKLNGYQNVNPLAALVRAVHVYGLYGSAYVPTGHRVPSINELLGTLDRHDGLESFASSRSLTAGLTAGMGNALSYLTWLASPDDHDEFMRLLATGDGLEAGNPIHTLRQRLMKISASKTNYTPDRIKWAFCARTWNAWMQGEQMTKLQFKAGGARPDRVSELVGLPKDEVA